MMKRLPMIIIKNMKMNVQGEKKIKRELISSSITLL